MVTTCVGANSSLSLLRSDTWDSATGYTRIILFKIGASGDYFAETNVSTDNGPVLYRSGAGIDVWDGSSVQTILATFSTSQWYAFIIRRAAGASATYSVAIMSDTGTSFTNTITTAAVAPPQRHATFSYGGAASGGTNQVSKDIIFARVLSDAEAIAEVRKSTAHNATPHAFWANIAHTTAGDDISGNSRNQTRTGTGNTVTDAPAFPDDTALVLVSRTPVDDATDVDPATDLVLEFGADIEAGSGNITIREPVAPSTPTLETSNTDAQNSNATTFTIDIPAISSPAAGTATYVVLGVAKDGNGAFTFPGGIWNVGTDAASGTASRAAVIWARFTASASATTINITGASENYISRAWVIAGGHLSQDPVFATVATGNSTAGNPPALTIPWGTEPSFVGYYVGYDGNTTISAHPTGWTTNAGSNTTSDGTTGNRCAQGYSHNINVTTGSEDPGALTNTNEQWIASTFAIRPADLSIEIEVIDVTDTGQVVFSTDTVTITPSAPLPEETLVEVLIASTAIEPAGGGTPWAGFTPGMWQFTTTTGIFISDVTPSTIRMNTDGIDITGSGLEATEGTIYISTNNSLGVGTDVDISSAITSWGDTEVLLDLSALSSGQKSALDDLGPGTRYIIAVTDSLEETNGFAITLLRSVAIVLSPSANIASGGSNSTTAQLTAPSGKTTGDFSAGRITDDTNPPVATNPLSDTYTEDEFALSFTSEAVIGETYEFRLLINGNPADTISVTPQITVAEDAPVQNNNFFTMLFNF